MEQNNSETYGLPRGSRSGFRLKSGSISPPKSLVRSGPMERYLLRVLLRALNHPPLCFVLWDGEKVQDPGSIQPMRVFIHDRGALYRLVSDPELQFGEMYSAGRIDVDTGLPRFLETVYRAMVSRRKATSSLVPGGLRRQRNTLSRARQNIYHHYDIGNDFYQLWLDEQMVYTCAYFPTQAATLEEAQVAKMDLVSRKLRLRPGNRVVEAGCGWGALALHMASHYGVTVDAYNISTEQVAYARDRAKREGLEDRVKFVEGDYREILGTYDVFVSVGMLEHVGADSYPHLAAVMDRCLTDNGRGLIHTIGRDQAGPLNSWLTRNIFPGAYAPSLREMMPLFEPRGFSVLDVENLRLHYRKTLEHWLERYEEATDRVEQMFDAAFVRLWRLYLAGSIAAFSSGTLQLFQVVFSRTGHNEIPWTRAHLLENAPGPCTSATH